MQRGGLWPDALSSPLLLPSLLLQLPTRRFVHAVLEDRAILVKCYMSRLYSHPQGRLFVQVGVLAGSEFGIVGQCLLLLLPSVFACLRACGTAASQIHATLVLPAPPAPPPTLLPQLVDLLRFYLSFPIHDHTGDPLSEDEVTAAHYERVQQLQRLFFKHVPKLRELALANCGTGGWAGGRVGGWLAECGPVALGLPCWHSGWQAGRQSQTLPTAVQAHLCFMFV